MGRVKGIEKRMSLAQRVSESFWDENTSDVSPVNPTGTPVSTINPTYSRIRPHSVGPSGGY